jgi:hypothetical protein
VNHPIIILLISAFITYWIIRWAVSGGMKDFDKWKRNGDGD